MYWNESTHNMISTAYKINRNMRCIEIIPTQILIVSVVRLIETWDVLK